VSFAPANDAKEQVRQATDIVDLVGSYVQLRRQGRNFVGLCPWHDDSRPSLQVNPERQSFKCWVCDYGGDVFSFVMRSENLEFREALEFLAERAGINLQPHPRAGSSSTPAGAEDRPAHDDKRTLLRVIAWAEEQFHHCLLAMPEGEPGRQYLVSRNISPDTARRFHLGYAPDRWDWLLDQATTSQWKPAILEKVGLLRRKELGSEYYDWFRGRLIFSIRDGRSRPVAFGGRVLPQLANDRTAKYINSPETPLFSKSRELYGLDLARDHFKLGGAIVMEGYTDVLMAHQHGINNVVAVLGTALGEQHLQLLHRYTDRITLVLDGDEAGRRRTNEILDALLALFEKKEVNLQILTLPEGIDPCDFIATHGSDAFRALVAQAVDPLEHKFRSVTNGLDTLTDTHRVSQAAEQLLATLAQIRPAGGGATSQILLREEQMLSRIARKFHLPEESLRSRLTALRREARSRTTTRAVSQQTVSDASTKTVAVALKTDELPAADRLLLELLLSHSGYFARIRAAIDPNRIGSPVVRRIYAAWVALAQQEEEPTASRLVAAFDEPQMKNLLVGLDEMCAAKPPIEPEQMLQDVLAAYGRRDANAGRLTNLAAARTDAGNAEQLLAQFCEQSKSKHRDHYERRKK
jgi:DNA primase